MQSAESCREAEPPDGNTHYHKGAAKWGSPLGERECRVRVQNEKGTIQQPLFSPPRVAHMHILTMAGEGEVMCAEPILHCCQGKCGMSQEVVTRTTVGQMEKWSSAK